MLTINCHNMYLSFIRRCSCSSALTKVKEVAVDPCGVYKYILANLITPFNECKLERKVIVRGSSKHLCHTDIQKALVEELKCLKLPKDIDICVVGGGEICIDSKTKLVKVHGKSMAFGKANHKLTEKFLKKEFKDYEFISAD